MASVRWLAVVVLGLVLGSAFWLLRGPADDQPGELPEVVAASSAVAAVDANDAGDAQGEAVAVGAAPVVAPIGTQEIDPGREAAEVAPAVWHGRVVDGSGQAVRGATVSWTPARLVNPTTPVSAGDLPRLLDATRLATTDERGLFELGGIEQDKEGIVWATSPSVGAGHVWVQAGGWEGALEVALQPAEPIQVTVTGGEEERPTEVWASAWPSEFVAHEPGTLGDADALALLVRKVAVVNGDAQIAGAAPVGGAETGTGALCLQATDGVLSSLPMRAVAGDELELELVASFELDGTVHTPAGVAPADVLVSVTLAGPSREELAARLVPDAEGHFGPVRLPLLEGCDSVLVQGFADGMAPVSEIAENPEPGGHAQVILDGEAGAEMVVQFVDQEGASLAGIQGRLAWRGPLGYYRTAPGWAKSAPDGRLRLGGAPEGLAWVQYQDDSYVNGWGGPFVCPTPEGKPPLVVLSPSGSITGIVTHLGEPVDEFRILAWPPSVSAQSAQDLKLELLGEGRFRAGEVPLGPVNLIAVADGLAQTAILTVTVAADHDEEVEFELPSPLIGTGWVKDETTGLAIPGAMVQPFLVSHGMAFGFHGEPQAADSNGHFEVAAFGQGLSSIGIRAEGFSEGLGTASPDDQGRLDFGEIALAPATYLEVLLEGPAGADWTGFTAHGYGGFNFPSAPVPADGRIVVDTARRGQFYLNVTGPDGTSTTTNWMLEGRGPWARKMAVGSLGMLEIHLSPDAVRAAGSGWLHLEVPMPMGDKHTADVGLDGETNLYSLGIPAPGEVTVQLGAKERVLVTKVIPSTTRSIDLDLGGESTTVRLVDPDGQPISNVSIGAFVPAVDGEPSWRNLLWEQTDAEGLAHLGELQLAMIDIAAYGDGMYQSFPAVATGEESELVLAPDQELQLQATDDGVPLAGVTLWILDAATGFFTITAHTDSDGRFQRTHFQTDAILIHSPDPNLWPETHAFDLSKSAGEVQLELRRRGNLALTLFDLLGNPASNIEVSLQSDEDPDPVSAWIEAGLVEAPSRMSTNLDGKLELQGLPRGTYHWSAGGKSGTLNVLAEETTPVEITIGD